MRVRGRRRPLVAVFLLTALLVLAGCSSGSADSGTTTVTAMVTVIGTDGKTTVVATPSVVTRSSASSKSSANPASTPASGAASSPGSVVPSGDQHLDTRNTGTGPVVKTEPDGLKITKLQAGEKPPQFAVFSFDGVGWDEKWQFWFGLSAKVPLHFTGFLSGIYLLSTQNKTMYTGPGHDPGKSSIGFSAPADIPVEIGNLNKGLAVGDEIGTHFNGHFCDDNRPGGNDWNTSNWDNELDQFFGFVKNVDTNNGISTKLDLTAAEIKGERTPCLTGHKDDLYPALESHGMTYDSSFTRPGLAWPVKSSDGKIWEMGMPEFPIAGTGHVQIMMDYNFWAQQENSSSKVTPAQSAKDSAQVLATYKGMLKSAQTDGVNEPLILGNHFEDWNNDAYSDALSSFALSACGQTGVFCVPFRDLIDWMEAQDPAVLAALQNHKSNFGGCPYTAFPHCDGKINY